MKYEQINEDWSLYWCSDELYAIHNEYQDTIEYCSGNGGIMIDAPVLESFGYGVPFIVITSLMAKADKLGWVRK